MHFLRSMIRGSQSNEESDTTEAPNPNFEHMLKTLKQMSCRNALLTGLRCESPIKSSWAAQETGKPEIDEIEAGIVVVTSVEYTAHNRASQQRVAPYPTP